MSQKMNAKIIKANAEYALREKAKRDLKAFLLLKWARFNKQPFMDNWHFDYICKTLSLTLKDYAEAQNERVITRLMLNMPPERAKSFTLATQMSFAVKSQIKCAI